MGPIRILHVSALPVWSMDGKGGMPSLRETLRGHLRAGYEVVLVLPKYHLFTDDATPSPIRHDEGYEVYVATCRWLPALKRVRAYLRRFGRKGEELPYVLRWAINLTTCALLTVSLVVTAVRARYRLKRRFDLVYAHNKYAALAGWLIALTLRIPNVTRLYGTFLADLMNRPLVWLRYPVAASGFLVPHSLLICANDGTRGDEVARKLGIDLRRFRFWQNGVDPPGEPPRIGRDDLMAELPVDGLRRESKWVVSCSRLSYWKRIDRMLHALKYARAAGCDCQLLVAGVGSEQARLCGLAQELGVAEHVIWLGAVAHDRIWALMHAADVFMITNDVTNRCNPLYEAICAGLPVVSVHDPSTRDLLEHGVNALLAEKEDVQALGDSLCRVCADSALTEKMRTAQRERAAGLWSWKERMEIEVRELESLVGSKGKRRRELEKLQQARARVELLDRMTDATEKRQGDIHTCR